MFLSALTASRLSLVESPILQFRQKITRQISAKSVQTVRMEANSCKTVPSIVVYVTVPNKKAGFYVLRHPRFHHKLPSVLLNFFRRLVACENILHVVSEEDETDLLNTIEMDLEMENKIVAILMKKVTELQRQGDKEGFHVCHHNPNVRGHPKSGFLPTTVLGVQQVHRRQIKLGYIKLCDGNRLYDAVQREI